MKLFVGSIVVSLALAACGKDEPPAIMESTVLGAEKAEPVGQGVKVAKPGETIVPKLKAAEAKPKVPGLECEALLTGREIEHACGTGSLSLKQGKSKAACHLLFRSSEKKGRPLAVVIRHFDEPKKAVAAFSGQATQAKTAKDYKALPELGEMAHIRSAMQGKGDKQRLMTQLADQQGNFIVQVRISANPAEAFCTADKLPGLVKLIRERLPKGK